jgi:SgrR family transcriptional regulator
MRLVDHFQHLHAALEAQPTLRGLPSMASALKCSERNARTLLRKMEARGWLRWQTARGRGHFSQLTMLMSPHDVLLDDISGLLADGDLEKAFASLDDGQRVRLRAKLPEFLHVVRNEKDARHQIRVPLYRQVENLDPRDVTGGIEVSLVFQLFSRLTEFDKRSQQLVSGLAHHWEEEDNGSVWHFWLRPGIRFHDGTKLEAEDVRQTFLRMRDTPGPFQNIYRHIESIEPGWGRKITFYLRYTDYLWPHALASAHASIVPQKRSKDFSSKPVGSGPFRLTQRSEFRLTLSAFDYYYRERALLDEIDLWIVSGRDETAGFDLHFGALSNAGTKNETITQKLSGCIFVMCNSNRAFFRKTAQRLAFADWLSPAALTEEDDMFQCPASGLLPRWEHRKAIAGRTPPIRTSASSLLMVTTQSELLQTMARHIKDRMSVAGVAIDVRTLSYGEFQRGDWQGSADLVLAIEALPDDEDFGCYEWFAAASAFRYWMSKKRQVLLDAQLRLTRAEVSAKARMERYSEIAKELLHEGWIIPLSHPVRQVRVESRVAGVRRLSFGLVPFGDLWLSEDALRS